MGELLKETLRLAKSSQMPVPDICKAARVKYRWYLRFVAGDFADPGVNKIERLNKVLRQQATEARS